MNPQYTGTSTAPYVMRDDLYGTIPLRMTGLWLNLKYQSALRDTSLDIGQPRLGPTVTAL